MKEHIRRSSCLAALAGAGVLLAWCSDAAAAPISLDVTGSVTSSIVEGVTVGAGTYSLQQLSNVGAQIGTVTADGFTGVSLWGLLGGNAAGVSDVVTTTPAGDNGKNAILRYYVLATSSDGSQSIISLGEIDPFFGGTTATPDFVASSGPNSLPALIFPQANAAGRDVLNLVSLRVLAAPALPNGPGGESTSLALSGNVTSPGIYNLSGLQSLPAVMETVKGDTYTGVQLWTLLGAKGNPLNQYVLASGTDGYEVLLSLAEIDPNLGAPNDLVPYSDNGGQFPADGFARIVIPGDNHAGRYISNLDSLEVAAVPEPRTVALFLFGFVGLLLLRQRLAGTR